MNFQCYVLYTHSPLESTHGQRQLQFVLEAFNTFSEFGPSRGERVHKYYAYCNSIKFLLIYVVFSKVKIIYFAISAPSFDKNNRHTTHTVSRSAIIFQTKKAAPVFLTYINIYVLM